MHICCERRSEDLKEVKMIKLLVSNIDAAASGLRVPGFH